MTRMIFKSIFCLAMFLTAGAASCGGLSSLKIKVTGIYSNMQYNAEAGDVLGQEIFIVFSKSGYFAMLQNSEGEPAVPVVVPVKMDGTNIYFHVPENIDSRGDFYGVISSEGLKGAFSGNGQKIELKRKNSYWQ